MKKSVYAVVLAFLVMLSGCADVNDVKDIEYGKIIENKAVVVNSTSDTLIGAGVGGVIGAMFGSGSGKILMAVGGAAAGAYAGHEMGKANAEELVVKLDSGKTISFVTKGEKYRTGDRVRITRKDDKVIEVELEPAK